MHFRPPQRHRRGAFRAPAGAAFIVATAVLALFVSPAAAQDNVAKSEADAKLRYCEVCHGAAAQGFHGYYPIPRLAGQPTEYLKNQLQAFVEHRRTSNIMFNVGHVLSPGMINALTADFNQLNPKPLGGAPKQNLDEGKRIFENGVASASVPPCASCHGPEAKGNGPFPRLAGQLYDYITDKLTNWDKERGQNPSQPDTSAVMQPIAHSLTQPQIKAVAAYLS
ncbi:MAG: c-type cytochrome, partial [Xanthobacteraceae bacterium]